MLKRIALNDMPWMRTSAAQHVVGMTGQVAAALPLLLITALISRTEGLEQAGKFTIAVGISAAAYAIALWGFRSYVVIDQLEQFAAPEYAAARALTAFVATLATIAAGIWLGIPFLLLLAVVFLRACDMVIDLLFGFNQVWRDPHEAMNAYTGQNLIKVAVVLAIGATSFLPHGPRGTLTAVTSSMVVFAGFCVLLLQNLGHHSNWQIHRTKLVDLFFRTRWFALAGVFTAVIVSAPRITLGWFYHGDLLGVVGISLSIANFFGMAFYTTWLRYLPQFPKAPNRTTTAKHFLYETIGIAILVVFASWLILPPLTAWAFGFKSLAYADLCREVMIASAVFYGCMNVVNLYKASRVQYLESLAYIAPFPVVALVLLCFPGMRGIPVMLIVAGITMLAMAIPAYFRLGPMPVTAERPA